MADLTPERLTDLRALAVAATPGPWFFDGYCRVSSSQKAQRYDSIEFPDCEVPAWKTSCGEPRGSCHGCPFFDLEYEVGPVVAYVEPHHGDTAVRHHAADAEFLGAVSPDVVVGLLDEIERLRAQAAAAPGLLNELDGGWVTYAGAMADMHALVEVCDDAIARASLTRLAAFLAANHPKGEKRDG